MCQRRASISLLHLHNDHVYALDFFSLSLFSFWVHSLCLPFRQINKMAKLHRINLVFAITAEQEPLYARLSQHIEGATSGVLASDSSNVVDLLTSSLKVC